MDWRRRTVPLLAVKETLSSTELQNLCVTFHSLLDITREVIPRHSEVMSDVTDGNFAEHHERQVIPRHSEVMSDVTDGNLS
jgi:hypothetical protein